MLDWLRRDPNAQETIDINGRILAIEVRTLNQARRLTMRLAPDARAVRITIPRGVPVREAYAFARSRRSWLAAQLARIPSEFIIEDGASIPFRGQTMRLRHDATAPRKVIIVDGDLRAGGPAGSLESRLKRWLQNEARAAIEPDLAGYCDKVGRPAPSLALSSAQRRWGSCSARGQIRINWRLIMAPDPVRRSVVAHEVAHLVHFDHSPAFHTCLAGLYEGDIQAANVWLREHGRTLYAPFG